MSFSLILAALPRAVLYSRRCIRWLRRRPPAARCQILLSACSTWT